jgi:hypothetical protein
MEGSVDVETGDHDEAASHLSQVAIADAAI